MKSLEEKSQITLIMQSIFMIIVFFSCETLFLTSLNINTYYVIGIICFLLALGLCKFFKFNLFTFKVLNKKEIIITILSIIVLEVLNYSLIKFIPTPNNQQSLNELVSHSNVIIAIITLGIFVPIIEECIFRGILIKVMFQKKQWLGVIVSIILFTLAHGPTNVTDYIIYGIPAIIYSIIYYKTQRLEIPIIIHILNNLLATLY